MVVSFGMDPFGGGSPLGGLRCCWGGLGDGGPAVKFGILTRLGRSGAFGSVPARELMIFSADPLAERGAISVGAPDGAINGRDRTLLQLLLESPLGLVTGPMRGADIGPCAADTCADVAVVDSCGFWRIPLFGRLFDRVAGTWGEGRRRLGLI